MRLWSVVLLAAVAVPAVAQEPTPPRERSDSVVRSHGFQFFSGPGEMRVEAFQRGRLGILVDLTADPGRDSIGARVAGLTPGGAAEKAGVKTGDLVVRLNGTALVRRSSRDENGDAEEEAQSRPGMRLIELASRLDPGDSVHLELRRGTQPVNLTVVAGESGMDQMTRTFRLDAPRAGAMMRDWAPRSQNFVFSGGPFADMELVKVNPGLADYFGTSEGLLVVNVGDDSTFGLKSGDVILSIGGRKPLNPAHALRILGTYEPNESVSFDIMRMKHRTTVSGKMPARRSGGWSITPDAFEFDVPAPTLRGFEELQDPPDKMMIRVPGARLLPKVQARVVTT